MPNTVWFLCLLFFINISMRHIWVFRKFKFFTIFCVDCDLILIVDQTINQDWKINENNH